VERLLDETKLWSWGTPAIDETDDSEVTRGMVRSDDWEKRALEMDLYRRYRLAAATAAGAEPGQEQFIVCAPWPLC